MGPEPGRGRGERRQPELRALLAIPACLAGKQGAQVACPELVGSPLHSPEKQLAMAWGPPEHPPAVLAPPFPSSTPA